jgi:YNFM family putative membrane transporter
MTTQRICDAMLPELSRIFDATIAQAAQVVSVFAIVYGLAQLFYGPLGDRYGKFRIVTFATLGCSVGSIVAAFADSLNFLIVARVMVAICAAAVIPLSLAWIGDAVAYEQRQETLAKVGLGTTLGIVGGQLIGGLFTDTLGWRWAFVLMTLLYGVVGALLYSDWRKQQLCKPIVAHTATADRPGFAAEALMIMTGPWSRIVLLVACVEGAAGFGILAITASHLHQVLGLSLSMAGAIVALFGLGGMFYMAIARHLIRRLGEQGLSLIGGCVLGLSFIVLGLTPWWQLTPIVSLVAGFAFFMLHNTMQANATQMAPAARGTAVSLFASFLFLGQAIGVLLAANLIARIGSGTVIAGGGGVLMALGVFLSQMLRRRESLAWRVS